MAVILWNQGSGVQEFTATVGRESSGDVGFRLENLRLKVQQNLVLGLFSNVIVFLSVLLLK